MRHTLALMLAAMLYPGIVVAQVEIPEGFEIVEITRSDYFTGFPTINNCGQIAFDQQLGPEQADKEIFLYDNGKIARITSNNVRDCSAKINGTGHLVWMRTTDRPPDDQIILYRDGSEIILDEHRHGVCNAAINNLGWVTWSRFHKNDCKADLLLWDGQTITQISGRNRLDDMGSDLNDLGDIAWQEGDFCVRPWTAEILLWSDGRTIVLPSSETQVQGPRINNERQIAWSAADGIEFWENGQTVLLTDWGGTTSLNNLGDMYFWRWHKQIEVAQPWVYRVSGGGEPRFYRLVDDPKAIHAAGDINDWAEAPWNWHRLGNLSGGMFFLRRIRTGDSEFDGDIDLVDYGAFAECMTGPGRVDRLCDCRFLDIDHDGDVDLGDFARFQNAFTGK